MPLTLSQSATAVGPRCPASFLAIGGTAPYTYSVVSGGAGGTIDPVTGAYTAPLIAQSEGPRLYDTVKVVDAVASEATAQILVGLPILLLCEIIQRRLNLENGRVYLWDQKIMQPTDSSLYVAVSVPRCKPFGNVNTPESTVSGMVSVQFVNMQATVDINIISRGTSARDMKELVPLALGSDYSKRQQAANGFYIARIPTGFINLSHIDLSHIDGAAIPYRYKISVQMMYVYALTTATSYFDDFSDESTIDP